MSNSVLPTNIGLPKKRSNTSGPKLAINKNDRESTKKRGRPLKMPDRIAITDDAASTSHPNLEMGHIQDMKTVTPPGNLLVPASGEGDSTRAKTKSKKKPTIVETPPPRRRSTRPRMAAASTRVPIQIEMEHLVHVKKAMPKGSRNRAPPTKNRTTEISTDKKPKKK